MRFVLALSASLSLACSGAGCSTKKTASQGSTVTASMAPATEPSGGGSAGENTALTEAMATPYFETGPAAPAAEALSLERWEEARDGFAQVLAGDDAPDDEAARARIRLLMAIADAEQDEWDRAAAGFESARAKLSLLSDYIGYHAARARYFAGDLDRALKAARSVDESSIVGADADLLIGDILRGLNDPDRVEDHYADYLDSGRGVRRAEARYRLAEALEELGESSNKALGHYRTITIEAPVSPWADRARDRIEALLESLPADARARHERYTADEHITRAMALYRAMRNPKSAEAFRAALDTGKLDADERCVALYHLAKSWYKERNRTRSAPIFDRAIEACNETDNEDLQVKSAYLAGRSYDKTDEPEKSIARFELIEKHHQGHTYCDDARLRQAEQYEEMGEHPEEVERLLSTIPERYPDGDMRAEAMWRLAWRAIKDDDHREAIRWLKKQIEIVPLDHNYWAEGQAQYWLGRAHAELGDAGASIAAYEEAVRRYPLSYYALLALNRLRDDHPDRFEALVAEIQTPADDHDPDAPALSFEPRDVYGAPGFRRGLELMRLGLGHPAEAEFRKLGLTPPAGKDPVTDPELKKKLWAMAFLYDRAGRYTSSHWVTRWHVLDYKRRWPVGQNRVRWRIAYPKAWWELLDRHASEHGYPTELQIAFVREESAFDPLMESYANAVGLTQMIFPTARRFAEGTGIEVTRDALRDPEKNVTIGGRFLDFLHEKFDGRVALVVPSYNAGEHATTRWLRERGDWPADEWAEEIPYDQARRYSKRVIATYFAYSYLNDGTIPQMPNELPDELP